MSKSQMMLELETAQLKQDIPEFAVGDTLRIHTRILEEGEKERLQVFTGTVVARKGRGLSETITLYRVSYGSCMERVFPLHSPKIAKIEVERKGRVRRAKLNYMRGATGKNSKVEQVYFAGEKAAAAVTTTESAT